MKKIIFALAALAGFGLGSSKPVYAAVCPAIGASTDCAVQITLNAGGAAITPGPSLGPYDGSEDTLIGITNSSGHSVGSVALSGSNIFGFEGDGIATFGSTPSGPTGYEGPLNTFTVTDAFNGFVNFPNGLADGQSTFFSLEESLDFQSFTVTGVASGVPEPSTWAMMLIGFAGLGFFAHRRKTHSGLAAL
jgi:PEP-CTERM motif